VRPPDPQKPAPNPRTFWSFTRQTFWLFFLLVVCIVFFRIFGPDKKEPTIEDFFRPGNPDVEFLDAIEFLEKYYERQRKQNAAHEDIPDDDSVYGNMQARPPVAGNAAGPFAQVADNTTAQESFPPASKGTTP
jgi:hypothetical protein